MSDAATDWIGPYWKNLPHPGTTNVRAARVWVLNPGPVPTKVSVRFFDANGGALIKTDSATVDPRLCRDFGAGAESGEGWCHITSDHPVMPWGFTAFETGVDIGYVNMSFYRADVAIPKFDPASFQQQRK
jgi:hypothetical protein